MTTFDTAFAEIQNLVDDFEKGFSHYLRPEYSEAQVRLDFIDKFFIALGWDVRNDNRSNPLQREVVIEKTQRQQQSKAQKRADYAFYVAPDFKNVSFFVEAKKPCRNLKNADDYFQTARYGWNAGVGISILTDFEELHIIDCRFKPDINKVFNVHNKTLHYTDYRDRDKFATLYWLFSKEAVLAGNVQKYATNLPKPKKGAAQTTLFAGKWQSIDESFLEYIDAIRETLARAFKKNDNNLSSELLTEAVTRTIDRLVFIRFLEDKLIEPENHVSEFGNRTTAWKDFINTCRIFDAKYNGAVFKKHLIDDQHFVGADDVQFKNICSELSHLNSPYDFNAIPIHILGSIYERFLGKVVIATDKRVKIEEKPEVRKAGGVYYTPEYIVDYIVKNTVGKLIEGKKPAEIARLKFADIACGSGSFLIGVYDTLLTCHTAYYNQHPDEAKRDKCLKVDGQYVLSIQQKQKILTNNIYGVDIDHQAMEVTQLSLYLKMLEDETTATANEMQVLFHEKILPNLSGNIKCGNSLIGTDILTGQLFSFEEERKLNPFDFATAFPEVFKNGGFDAVVGNPPYVNIASLPEEERRYYQSKFSTCRNKSDLYSFFIEKANSLLNKNGRLGYIIPHTWLATDSFQLLRKLLLDQFAIEQLVEMGFNVFKDAIVSTVILICSPENKKINVFNKVFEKKFLIDTNKYIQDNYFIDLDWTESKEKIYSKLKNNTSPLSEMIQFSRGIKTSDDKRFLSTENKNSDYKKIFRGKNIKAYQLNWNGEYIWYRPDLMREKVGSLPHTKEFFEVPEKIVTQRVNSSNQLLVAYDNEQQYFLDTTNVSRYTSWDKKHSHKFICGILNSKLINYWYCNKYKMPTIGGYELHSIPIKTIDFSDATSKVQHDQIVNLVTQLLSAKKQLSADQTDLTGFKNLLGLKSPIQSTADKEYLERKCHTLDSQIDTLVYKLYGISEEEIKMIEKA